MEESELLAELEAERQQRKARAARRQKEVAEQHVIAVTEALTT